MSDSASESWKKTAGAILAGGEALLRRGHELDLEMYGDIVKKKNEQIERLEAERDRLLGEVALARRFVRASVLYRRQAALVPSDGSRNHTLTDALHEYDQALHALTTALWEEPTRAALERTEAPSLATLGTAAEVRRTEAEGPAGAHASATPKA